VPSSSRRYAASRGCDMTVVTTCVMSRLEKAAELAAVKSGTQHLIVQAC
jgi:hypothetical protein